jgi:hypothetical protein
MEAVGIGDLHLGKLDAIIPDANRLIASSIGKVLDYAVDNGVGNVFFYGDIGEKPRLSYESQIALKVLFKKRYQDLSFKFILGNHDFAEDGVHSLQVLETFAPFMKRDITVYTKPEQVYVDGSPFHFLPYPYNQTAKGHVGVGHFEVKGSKRDNGKIIEEGFETKATNLLGHLHTCHRVARNWYSGTLYQTNFGESLPKSFHHVKWENGTAPKEIEVENIRFTPPWKLVNLTVNTESDLDVIRQDKDKRSYYKLFIKDGLDLDLNRILAENPNILRHNVFKSKKDLEVLIDRDWDFDVDSAQGLSDFDEREVVSEFIANAGLKKSQVKRGLSILDGLSKRGKSHD